jgi:hypothetical protein
MGHSYAVLLSTGEIRKSSDVMRRSTTPSMRSDSAVSSDVAHGAVINEVVPAKRNHVTLLISRPCTILYAQTRDRASATACIQYGTVCTVVYRNTSKAKLFTAEGYFVFYIYDYVGY